MPKTYTATEVLEMGRECLGEKEEVKLGYSMDVGLYITIRNALRAQFLERLEKRLSEEK